MHDPHSLAFEIYLGSKKKKNGQYRTPFISIWHKDPEKRGDDDSCGWFVRCRHIDQKMVDKVRADFAFNFKHNYWFNDGGYPSFSTIGTAVNLYFHAAWQMFMYMNNGKPDRKRTDNFMKKHIYEIIRFAENPTDSLYDSIHMKYGVEDKEYRVNHFTSVITADIMRKIRPWYKHPRWHMHHWQITFPLFRGMYRNLFAKQKQQPNQNVDSNLRNTI